jgi:hypothetical protein
MMESARATFKRQTLQSGHSNEVRADVGSRPTSAIPVLRPDWLLFDRIGHSLVGETLISDAVFNSSSHGGLELSAQPMIVRRAFIFWKG